MTGIATHGVFVPELSTRGPASSVLEECLRAQLRARPRGAVARFFGLSPLHPEARARYRKALGELRAATVFSRLGPEFTVLRAVSEKSAEQGPDHLIVGPPGIFAVTTKSFSAKRIRVGGASFMVNGRKNGCVVTAQRDAAQASLQLSDIAGTHIEVAPLIVVVEPRSLSLNSPQIAVTESARVARWFATLPRTLSDDTIQYLSTIAELPGEWRVSADASDDTQRHTQRFDRLRREVDAARHRARNCLYVSLSMLVGGGAVAVTVFSEPLLAMVGLS